MSGLKKELGGITSGLITRVLTGIFPDLQKDIQENPLLLKLADGDFTVHDELTSGLKRQARDYLINVQGNPFANDVKDVTRALVGSTIVRISSPGNVEAALITSAAGYQGDGFSLEQKEAGTWGVWRSSQRGGYGVSCISAHLPGEKGYVAIWGATNSEKALGMGEFTEKFSPEGFDGRSIIAIRSPLKVMMRDSDDPNVTSDLRVYAGDKKGKGCVASYILASNERE
ncbi:hypothetical protein FJZ18_00420 [Candidatus Pacearchaeota archaeon]|nr:hypothetical protein [Candidatus Pacearchaeota archaeon]